MSVCLMSVCAMVFSIQAGDRWQVTGERWQVTGHRWHVTVTGDKWHVPGDRGHVTGDMWQVTDERCHMTGDRWLVTGDWWQFSMQFHFLLSACVSCNQLGALSFSFTIEEIAFVYQILILQWLISHSVIYLLSQWQPEPELLWSSL